MPALSNAKHERFAQELAKGATQAEAYVSAGYAPSEPNASRLTSNEKVQARVAEILDRAAIRSEITVASITERLLAIAAKGEQSKDAPLLSVARASLMDAAKLNGLVVDKSLTAATTVEDLLDRLDT
jgi:phage terminase small subunit